MNKSILISIRPEHVVKILNGEKTLELRKSVPTDFENIIKKHGGIWVNIYVTKALPFLIDYHGEYILSPKHLWGLKELNGKVVARFWFDKHTMLLPNFPMRTDDYDYFDAKLELTREIILRRLGLNKYDLSNYGEGKMIYAWHIKKLEIFDKPKELSEFSISPYMYLVEYRVHKAPQSWQYVWEKE